MLAVTNTANSTTRNSSLNTGGSVACRNSRGSTVVVSVEIIVLLQVLGVV